MGYVLPSQAYQVMAQQNNIIKGEIARWNARKSMFLPLFDRGTFDLNQGNTYRRVVQEAPALANSLVRPVFTSNATTATVCAPSVSTDKMGQKEFTVTLQTLPGKSDPICMKVTKAAFISAVMSNVRSLKAGIKKLVDADCRNTAVFGGGTKLIMSTSGFDYGVTGSILTPDVAFPQTSTDLPDLPVTFKALKTLAGYQQDALQVEPFPGSKGEMFLGIFSLEAVDYMRDLEGLNLDIRSIVSGGFSDGKKMIGDYEFQGPFRGISFARDPQPLRAISFAEFQTTRFTGIDASTPAIETVVDETTLNAYIAGDNQLRLQGLVPGYSNLVLVEPEVGFATSTGVSARPNPAWVRAKYEIGLFAGMSGYSRLVPPRYGGEDIVQYPNQLTPERLEFKILQSPTANEFGHNGWLLYEIERAFEPTYPQAFAGVVYVRPSLM